MHLSRLCSPPLRCPRCLEVDQKLVRPSKIHTHTHTRIYTVSGFATFVKAELTEAIQEERTGVPVSRMLPVHAAPTADGDAVTGRAEEEDNGAIEIPDTAADDDTEAGLEAHQHSGADTLLGVTAVLTGGEEAPPRLTRDYAAAFFNTDPRIAFDALHIGALRAIEECEGMTWSRHDYPPWYVPTAAYIAAPPSSLPSSSTTAAAPAAFERAFFCVDEMHPLVQSRAPIDREDHRVDELIQRVDGVDHCPSRTALTAAIGPDMLEKLRLHRSGGSQRRRRRTTSSQEPPKKRESLE